MLVGKHGYVPEPYFLTETLRSQSRFHDPLQDSLFSHSGSVQGFRQWNNGRSTPQPVESSPTDAHKGIYLTVRSSRPIGHSMSLDPSVEKVVKEHEPQCIKISENLYEAQLPTLVTPRSTVPGDSTSKCIRYAILEVRCTYTRTTPRSERSSGTLFSTAATWTSMVRNSRISDSFGNTTADWLRIATEIELNYTAFDAFVILHGTDTMAFTSSALSFLLEDLGKTVVRIPNH